MANSVREKFRLNNFFSSSRSRNKAKHKLTKNQPKNKKKIETKHSNTKNNQIPNKYGNFYPHSGRMVRITKKGENWKKTDENWENKFSFGLVGQKWRWMGGEFGRLTTAPTIAAFTNTFEGNTNKKKTKRTNLKFNFNLTITPTIDPIVTILNLVTTINISSNKKQLREIN